MVQLDDDERRALRHKAREATLEALRALGGEAQRRAIREHALAQAGFTERELSASPPEAAGDKFESLVHHNLAWALTNLKRDGLVERTAHAVWRLAGAALEPVEPLVSSTAPPDRLTELQTMRYRDYLRSPEWRQVRAAALLRAGNACALDASHTEDLEVHHRSYERRGAELPTDVIVLCQPCHRLHHQAHGRPSRPVATANEPRSKPASLFSRLLNRRAA
jgi:5-methylcytosine-specific restriction endonuclease McrA